VLREAGHRSGVVRRVAARTDEVGRRIGRAAREAAVSSTYQGGARALPKDAYDIQYEFPFGWQEFEGIHNRTNFDLSRHQEFSGKKLEYLDVTTNERFIPYVVETSAGADRTTLVVMADAYHEEEVEGEKRVVLRLHPAIAPLK